MKKTIALMGAFDSKGEEYLYIKNLIEKMGMDALTIHVGVFDPLFEPDISNRDVALAAGADLSYLQTQGDRGTAVKAMSEGLEQLLPVLYEKGLFQGALSVGGSGGAALATPAMRKLPFGVPKMMVATMASGNVAPYVGTSDLIMIPSIVDISGLNYVTRRIFHNAVAAVAGMIGCNTILPYEEQKSGKPLIATTMYGVTTPCVDRAKKHLEEAGYEVLVFHATGTGGNAMEDLIRRGVFAGVLDITTTEWIDRVAGGMLPASEHRLEAAIDCKLPQVVSVGAVDMVTFGPWDSVPEKFKDRKLLAHNPMITVMRSNVEENIALGKKFCEKWNKAQSTMVVLLPLKGTSMNDAAGKPFEGLAEREALYSTIKNGITNPNVKVVELDYHINDEVFACAAAQTLIELLRQQ